MACITQELASFVGTDGDPYLDLTASVTEKKGQLVWDFAVEAVTRNMADFITGSRVSGWMSKMAKHQDLYLELEGLVEMLNEPGLNRPSLLPALQARFGVVKTAEDRKRRKNGEPEFWFAGSDLFVLLAKDNLALAKVARAA